jgi:hypothetical protein
MGHVAGADIPQMLGDLTTPVEHARPGRRMIVVDLDHLGVFGVQRREEVCVASFDAAPKSVDVEANGG